MSNPTDSKEDDNESDDGLSGVADFVQIYMISLDIIGAHNIEKADTFGKSDPYLKVSAFSTSYTTCTIKKTLNPTWNEHIEMTFFNDPKQLKFELFDYDGNTKDDAIGDCSFKLEETIYSPQNEGFSGKIKLENCKSGEIEIKVVARKLLPLELERKLSDLQDKVEKNGNDIEELDLTITDWNNKNQTEQNEINTLNTNITNITNNDIPNNEKELKDEQDKGDKLKEEEGQIEEEINGLDQEYVGLEKEEKELIKELEDIKIEEDKKRTEIEHLRKDLIDLNKQIKERKEREEQQRKEREEREKRESQSKSKSEQKEMEKVEDVRVQPTPKDSNDASEPLVKNDKNKPEAQSDGGCACCNIL